jgi:hydroxymethylbilane synthase
MLRLGSRGSMLALTQSRWVAARLQAATGLEVRVKVIRTQGDAILDKPLSAIGGKGLFTKELDQALLDGEIDLAVHSLKDLPTEFPDGLSLGAVPEREDPRDVLIGPPGDPVSLETLPLEARVGTSSLRRAALLKIHRPDLRVEEIRGNLDTRLAKLDAGEFDAIVLAAAGIRRLGWEARIHESLDPGSWLPAPGQGALGVVVRSGDRSGAEWLGGLDDGDTRAATSAERALLHELEAGCRLPVAALAVPFGSRLRLRALVASPDGMQLVRAEGTGFREESVPLGRRVASILLERGADLLLEELRGREPSISP